MPGKAGAEAGKPGRPWLRLASRAGGRARGPPAVARACPVHSYRLQTVLRNPKSGSLVPSHTIYPLPSPPSFGHTPSQPLCCQGSAPSGFRKPTAPSGQVLRLLHCHRQVASAALAPLQHLCSQQILHNRTNKNSRAIYWQSSPGV